MVLLGSVGHTHPCSDSLSPSDALARQLGSGWAHLALRAQLTGAGEGLALLHIHKMATVLEWNWTLFDIKYNMTAGIVN